MSNGDIQDTSPYKISMMNVMMYSEPPKLDSPEMKKIEEFTNTKLDINWVPGAPYIDKMSTTIASGELPMVMLSINGKDPNIINAVRSGMFWEIGPYLKEFPNLEKLNKDVFNNVSIDGKIYSLFKTRDLVGDGILFRKDWLDNLGLKEPKTIDELYNVIKAFTLNDPDKNGKNDTIGLVEESGLRGFKVVLAYHGAPNGWELKDGKLIPDLLTPEYLDSLKFMRRLFDEKLMNQDFAATNRAAKDAFINKSIGGMYFSGIDQITRFPDLIKVDPKAKIDVMSRITGPKGERLFADNGYNGEFFFPKKAVKTEADLKKILGFFDKLSGVEMQNLFRWGLEGIHYTLKDGKPTRTQEQTDKYSKEIKQLEQQLLVSDESLAMKGDDTAGVAKVFKMVAENSAIAVPNIAYPIISNTYVQKGGDLDIIYKDARIKFIMGQIDEAGWQKALENWRQSGGDKVIEEYNSEYAKIKK